MRRKSDEKEGESEETSERGFYLALGALVLLGVSVWLCVRAHRRSAAPVALVAASAALELRVTRPVGWEDEISRAVKSSLPERLLVVPGPPENLERIAREFTRCGWVEGVRSIALRGDRLCVELCLRQPYAFVQRAGKCVLVDAEARLLPFSCGVEEALKRGLPVVRAKGVRRWERPAMSLVGVLHENKRLLERYGVRVVYIDASGGGRYNLVSADGRIFEWGYPPDGSRVPYLSVREKLGNMELVLKNPLWRKTSEAVLWTRPALRARRDAH